MKMQSLKLAVASVAGLLVAGACSSSQAAFCSLDSNNSGVVLNSDASLQSWQINSANETVLSAQTFDYKLNNVVQSLTGGGESTLGGPTGPSIGTLSYTNGSVATTLTFTLTGGKSGTSTSGLSVQVEVDNNGSTPVALQWDSNFALNGTVSVANPGSANNGLTAITLASDAQPAVVTNNGATMTFQWNSTIQPNDSFSAGFVENLQVVPEPASLSVLALGAGALLRRRRQN